VLDASQQFAHELYDELSAKVAKAHSGLEKRLDISRRADILQTSDWYGEKMTGVVTETKPSILKLSAMLGGLDLAIDLVMYIGECSYIKDPRVKLLKAKGEKGSCEILHILQDEDTNNLLFQILTSARQQDQTFKPQDQIDRIRQPIDYLKRHSIETHFVKSYGLISSWA